MNNTVQIRDARREDIQALAAFNVAMASETENRALDSNLVLRGVSAVFDRPQRGFYLVAEMNQQVVGGLLITTEWSDWRCAEWWWIQSVYVIAPARAQGVYRALHNEVQRRAREQPTVAGLRLYVERGNRAAQRTYVSMGMHETPYRMYEAEQGVDGR